MSNWLKLAIEIPLGLVLWYIGTCLWTIRFTRLYFVKMFDDPKAIQGALDVANMTRPIENLTEDIKRITTRHEDEISAIQNGGALEMMELAALVPATFQAWKVTRNRLVAIAFVLLIGSFFVSPYLVLANALVLCLLARYLGLHSRSYSDALGALLPIVKVIVRWVRIDPSGCRNWCTQLSPKFMTVYAVVSKASMERSNISQEGMTDYGRKG
jgi:hypothetical protein